MNLNISETFKNIYDNNVWFDGESRSGLGSSSDFTLNIRNFLSNFILENNIKLMIDTSCGDWNWMKQIKNKLPNYTGIDVVPELIIENNLKYKTDSIKFVNDDFLNFLKKIDKKVDLILCRHTLEHLDTEYNIEFLKNCKNFTKFLLVTTHKKCIENTKLSSSIYRPINLELNPYKQILPNFISIYDGPTSHVREEMYINLYEFTN